MATTAYWAPNQGLVAQVRKGTFSAPNSVGNTYSATINGKAVTYSSVSGDTAALAATGLFNLLNVSTGIAAEFLEITWANPSDGVVTATAKVPGTPFANVPGTSDGLVFSTGNGLSGGITTTDPTANASPSDVNDPQNWLRVTPPAAGVRQLPQNTDDVDVRNSNVPMLWNLDQLAAVQFNTYTRWQSMTGAIGLPENNDGGYKEWRAKYFKFSGPQGSVPSGGLVMILGQGSAGSGPPLERYNVGSQPTTLNVLASGRPSGEYGVEFLGVHTANTFTLMGGVSLGIAMNAGEIANITTSKMSGGSALGIGPGVTWTPASTLTVLGGKATLNARPNTLAVSNAGQVTVTKDELTWPVVTLQGGSTMRWLAGGTLTALTMTTGSRIDKTADLRALTITDATIDGDTCVFDDPNNTITFTNFVTVNQRVNTGPFRFTGLKSVRVA